MELIVLESGGILVDNPGMREVGIADTSGGLETTFDSIISLSLIWRKINKLTIVNNSSVIQGLLSLSIENGFIYINLLERTPFNIGKGKLYEGVP